MSVNGPCLWVQPLSSSVPSSLSGVTSHLSTVTRHGERVSSVPRITSPLLTLQRNPERGTSNTFNTEMQPLGVKAGNALSTQPVPVTTMGPRPHPGQIASTCDSLSQRPGNQRAELLPKMKLEISSGDGASLSTSQEPEADKRADSASSSQPNADAKDEPEESTTSPSDEKAEAVESDENQRSPGLDKKKMKRFRLTHNQTRFLMSEFTRQAHPDAAHRERLSREIPGLTPRQVQVWFQNRRAKLKRLTTNDRERMLKSRALPDNFDTTKVLRTPFEDRSTEQTPVASPHDYGAHHPAFTGLRPLRTDCYQRPNEDDYLISPLSSTSTAGTYMSSAGRGQSDDLSQPNMVFSRPAASASMSDLQRTIRSDYSLTRSSSLSDASPQPPALHAGHSLYNRYNAHLNHQSGHYRRPPLDYHFSQHPGSMAPAYQQHRPFENSVSPTDSQGAQTPYDLNRPGTQPPGYQPHLAISAPKEYMGLRMSSQIPPLGQQMRTMPVSAPQDYRLYSYSSPSGSAGASPYMQVNTSSLSLPTTFAPSEQEPVAHEQVQQNSQALEPLRAKFGNEPYSYANYIQH